MVLKSILVQKQLIQTNFIPFKTLPSGALQPTSAWYLEAGILPLAIRRKSQTLKYYTRV
jgi:hypothetical protein